MAWTDLKAAVAAVIKTNGNQEITGAVLQSILNSIIDQVGANATFKGVAIPSTSPGTPDGPQFYIASQAGTYANFGGQVISNPGIYVFTYSTSWTYTLVLDFFTTLKSYQRPEQRTLPTSMVFISSNGTAQTGFITGIYGYSQLITESPSYTGAGYQSITYQFVSETPSNYRPMKVYVKGANGANNVYRSILIVDENGIEIFKTNRSGDFTFDIYHNWKIQATCDNFYLSPTVSQVSTYLNDHQTRITANEVTLTSYGTRITANEVTLTSYGTRITLNEERVKRKYPVAHYMDLKKGATRVALNATTWNAPTITSDIQDFKGMSIIGSRWVFPNPWTVTNNGNIIGYDLKSGVSALTGNQIKLFFAIYSDTAITNFVPRVDNLTSAKILSSNISTLKIGWNFFWVELEFLVNNPTTSFLTFDKSNGDNNNLQGATIFVCPGFKTESLDYTLTDYLLSQLIESAAQLDASVFNQIIMSKDYAYRKVVYVDSWQTDTVSTYTTKSRNGVSVSGVELVLGTLTSETGGTIPNIFGFNLKALSGDRVANDVYTVVVSVWSDRDMDSLTPTVFFGNANGQLLETNFTFLKEGWNIKYFKVKVTANETTGEQQFFLFNRGYADNKSYMAGATLFISNWIISLDDIKMLDYNILELMKRVYTLEQQLSGVSVYIPAIGDSLTAGAGADKTTNKTTVLNKLSSFGVDITNLSANSTPYPYTMQEIIGADVTVVNMGVGGENINTIAARQGAAPIILPKTFILPATAGTTVEVADSTTDTLKSSFDFTSVVSPLLQGAGNSVNPCYVEGIECTLTLVTGTPNRYYLKRNTTGERDITIPAGTSLILYGAKAYRNPKAAIIWCWQNGGYSSDAELVEKLDKIISNLGTSNFILVGLHTGDASSRASQEQTLTQKYGDRFFNWRKYVSSNALYDFGITPTTDSDLTAAQISNGVKSDTYQMSIGALPSSLWRNVYGVAGDTSNDFTHMNAAGYMILGWKLVERLKIIGSIN